MNENRVLGQRMTGRYTLDRGVGSIKKGDIGAEEIHCGKSIPGNENSMCKGPEKGLCLVCWRHCPWTGVGGEQVGEAGREQILQKLVVCGQESRFYSQSCGKPKKRLLAGVVYGLISVETLAVECACLQNKIRNCHLRTWHPSINIFGAHMVPSLALWRTSPSFSCNPKPFV